MRCNDPITTPFLVPSCMNVLVIVVHFFYNNSISQCIVCVLILLYMRFHTSCTDITCATASDFRSNCNAIFRLRSSLSSPFSLNPLLTRRVIRISNVWPDEARSWHSERCAWTRVSGFEESARGGGGSVGPQGRIWHLTPETELRPERVKVSGFLVCVLRPH